MSSDIVPILATHMSPNMSLLLKIRLKDIRSYITGYVVAAQEHLAGAFVLGGIKTTLHDLQNQHF
jgi:hypothetical protein